MKVDNISLLGGNLDPMGVVKKFMMFEEDPDDGGVAVADPDEGGEESEVKESKPSKFYEGFSEDVRNHPSVQKFKSSEDLAKSYVNLEKKISAKGIIKPEEGASQEVIDQYYRDLGAVMDEDGVEIIEPPEGVDERIKVSEEGAKSFKEFAVKGRFTPDQIRMMQEFDIERQNNAIKAAEKEYEERRNESESTLRKEYGAKYEENIAKATQLVKSLGGDKTLEAFKDGKGIDPDILRFLVNTAEKVSEDVLGTKGSSGMTMTPTEAKAKIDEIRGDPKSAYNDGNHRNHHDAVEYMKTLYKFANPQ